AAEGYRVVGSVPLHHYPECDVRWWCRHQRCWLFPCTTVFRSDGAGDGELFGGCVDVDVDDADLGGGFVRVRGVPDRHGGQHGVVGRSDARLRHDSAGGSVDEGERIDGDVTLHHERECAVGWWS